MAGVLLVELPLPWPATLTDLSVLAGVHRALAEAAGQGRRIRLQLVEPPEAERRPPALRLRLAERSRPDRGSFDVQRDTVVVAGDDALDGRLGDAVRALLAGGGAPARPDEVVLHVCTNGRRDVCCGSLGTRLATELAVDRGLRVRRTTHTGGHRFAPTGFTLPDGAFWGRLDDPAVARAILDRDGPVSHQVQAAFRGTAHSGDPAVQVVEQVLLGELGWELLSSPRRAEAVARPEGGSLVVLQVHGPDGRARTFDAVVVRERMVEVAGCRTDETTTYEQLALQSLQERS
jgi:hypothetical protein